jgi:hypothetical protein
MSNDAGNGGAVKESEPPRRATTEDSSPANVHNSDPKVSAPPRARERSIANTVKILKTSTQCVERFAAAKQKPRAVGSSRHSHILKHLPQKRLSVGPDGAPAHQGKVCAIAAGGGIVAAGGVDKALYVHCIGRCQKTDCRSESCAEPLEGDNPHVVKVDYKSIIYAVALCHDCSSGDTYIAAGGEDKRVSVYHARNGFASLRLPLTLIDFEFKSKESVLSASLRWRTNQHPKAKVLLLAFGGMDSHVRVFDVLGRVLIYSMELPDIIRSVVLHPTKDLLAIAKTSRVLLLEMADVFDAHSEVFTLS